MEDDKKLIARILCGEKEAFTCFVKKYQKLVSHVVFRLVRNETDREDICQDIFIKIYRNLGTFRYDSKLSTWIASIAHNTCLHYLEKKRVPLYEDLTDTETTLSIEQVAETGRTIIDAVISRDIGRCVRKEIDNLPHLLGLLVALYHLEEMSYEEIAGITRLPMGTVKSYLYRARKQLKTQLMNTYLLEDIWQ